MDEKKFVISLFVLVFVNITLLTVSYLMDNSYLYTAAITFPLMVAGVISGLMLKKTNNNIPISKVVKLLMSFVVIIGLISYILVLID